MSDIATTQTPEQKAKEAKDEKIGKINLRKGTLETVKTAKGLDGIKAQVILVLDYSGSMSGLYNSGFVQELVERIVPISLGFDDNGELDIYLFDNNCRKLAANVTMENFDGYVNTNIIGKYTMGGTSYAPIVRQIVEDFGNKIEVTKGGFLSKDKSVTTPNQDPVYVIFITDGNNSDKAEAVKAITEAANHGIFFQFVGIGSADFPFLEKLDTMEGRLIDNANFFKVVDLTAVTDEDLYGNLLTEFPSYIPLAKKAGLIVG